MEHQVEARQGFMLASGCAEGDGANSSWWGTTNRRPPLPRPVQRAKKPQCLRWLTGLNEWNSEVNFHHRIFGIAAMVLLTAHESRMHVAMLVNLDYQLGRTLLNLH
jgi:hypothetical protein